MSELVYHYPMELGRDDIEKVLPHRGDIFVCRQLTVEGPHQFTGVASWPLDNAVIQGHFPGMPIVPGVLLIEAMAQFAGAGLLVGDPYLKTLPQESVGVLAAVRNCWFTSPVRPETSVEFFIKCRQLAPALVQANASVKVGEAEVARLDISMAYVPREQLFATGG